MLVQYEGMDYYIILNVLYVKNIKHLRVIVESVII